MNRDKALRRRCGIPPGHQVFNVLAVGYADRQFRRAIPRRLHRVHGADLTPPTCDR